MWICIAPCREHTSKALRYGAQVGYGAENGCVKFNLEICAFWYTGNTCSSVISRSITIFKVNRLQFSGLPSMLMMLQIGVALSDSQFGTKKSGLVLKTAVTFSATCDS